VYQIQVDTACTVGRASRRIGSHDITERPAAQFLLVVHDRDSAERTLNNVDAQLAAGFFSGDNVSPTVPVLPGAGPRWRVDPAIAEEFLGNVPGNTFAGVDLVGSTPTQVGVPALTPSEPRDGGGVFREEQARVARVEEEVRAERERADRQREADARARAEEARRAEADRDEKARQAEARRAEQARRAAEAQSTSPTILSDRTERSMVERYMMNLAGRMFDLSGPVFYRSVCAQYPQHLLVVLHDRNGRLISGSEVRIQLDGESASATVTELRPGGVFSPWWPERFRGFRLRINGTLVATVKTRSGAGPSVWVPILCDRGRYFVGGRAGPVMIE